MKKYYDVYQKVSDGRYIRFRQSRKEFWTYEIVSTILYILFLPLIVFLESLSFQKKK